MNFSLLIAVVVAFGLRLDLDAAPLSRTQAMERCGLVMLLSLVPVALSLTAGSLVRRRLRRAGAAAARTRLGRWGLVVDLVAVGLYLEVIFGLEWPAVVERGFGLRDSIVLDEAAILAPFLVFQTLGWLGLAGTELSLRPGRTISVGRHLLRKARHAYGLVLPAALVLTLALDVARSRWPATLDSPAAQLFALVLMGAAVLALAPALVRIAWPTRPMPDGPLRQRLDRLARRLGFRYTDILIWDTERSVVNAGVTGALPWFRYVLLTDLLVATLDDEQIEAVFGHEVGHIVHRHLASFGLFFVGSMGLMALVGQGLTWALGALPGVSTIPEGSPLAWVPEAVGAAGWLLAFVGYVLLVFGFLSRRFERQADVYGCRVVSCGRSDCPPHGPDELEPAPTGIGPQALCPVGVRTFAAALTHVALLNGMELRAGSWRHGSIRDRILFLEGLADRPEAERRFQARVRWLRLGVTLGLLGALAAAVATGALEQL